MEWITEDQIRNNLSIEGYIHLINQYNELEVELNDKRKNLSFDFQTINSELKVFKKYNITVPCELNALHQSMKEQLNNLCEFYINYQRLMNDIEIIVGIKNLRNVVYTILNKDNKSYDEIAKIIDISDNSLITLVNKGYIELNDFEKFKNYYKIDKIADSWMQRYIKGVIF